MDVCFQEIFATKSGSYKRLSRNSDLEKPGIDSDADLRLSVRARLEKDCLIYPIPRGDTQPTPYLSRGTGSEEPFANPLVLAKPASYA